MEEERCDQSQSVSQSVNRLDGPCPAQAVLGALGPTLAVRTNTHTNKHTPTCTTTTATRNEEELAVSPFANG